MFGTKKNAIQISRRQSLAAVPVVNNGVDLDKRDDGSVLVRITVMRPTGGLLSRFQPASFERCIKLDELGSFVLGQIDGKRTVLEIIESFVARFGTNRREAELSTVEFLKTLVKRRVLSLVIK